MSSKHLTWVLVAAALGVAACGDPLEVGSTDQALQSENPIVPVPDQTPACYGLNLRGADVSVFVVANSSDTLLVMNQQGAVVCMDDPSGVSHSGVAAAAMPADPDDPSDPANDGHVVSIGGAASSVTTLSSQVDPTDPGGPSPDEGTPLPAAH